MKTWVVVALIGCGASLAPIATAPPVPTPLAPHQVEPQIREPHNILVVDPPPVAHTSRRTAATWPLPALDLPEPNLEDYGRWPLTIAEHPALEPHFAIADALADAGITWTELCVRGAQHRHLAGSQELVDYLGAWCDVAHRDFESAIQKLGTVRRSTTRGLERAVTFDVAAITAAHGDAHDLESFLRHGGFLTLEQVDLVAASYFEIGRLADAAAANKLATQMDYAPTETARCTRLLRGIVDAQGADRDELVEALRRVAHPRDDDARGPRCATEEALLRCSQHGDCSDYWAGDGTTTNGRLVWSLISARRQWTESGRAARSWSLIVNELVHSGPPRAKYALLLTAAGLAVRGSDCELNTLDLLAKDLELAEQILEPTLVPAKASRAEVEVHDFEITVLTKTEREDLRRRIHAIAEQTRALRAVAPNRMVCLDDLARLPAMAP